MIDKYWLEGLKDFLCHIIFPIFVFVVSLGFLVFVILASWTRRADYESKYIQLEQVGYGVFVDKTTGVLYYRFQSGMTPIYNADGTLKLYEGTE
jgi:hypothetical protein